MPGLPPSRPPLRVSNHWIGFDNLEERGKRGKKGIEGTVNNIGLSTAPHFSLVVQSLNVNRQKSKQKNFAVRCYFPVTLHPHISRI